MEKTLVAGTHVLGGWFVRAIPPLISQSNFEHVGSGCQTKNANYNSNLDSLFYESRLT